MVLRAAAGTASGIGINASGRATAGIAAGVAEVTLPRSLGCRWTKHLRSGYCELDTVEFPTRRRIDRRPIAKIPKHEIHLPSNLRDDPGFYSLQQKSGRSSRTS